MKFVEKVENDFPLQKLFNEHLNKFNFKHGKELLFLDDVRNFVEKKSQIDLQYSQQLSKLCNQFLCKQEYQINDDSNSSIYIPEKWKLILDQYSYIAEKKQASSRSLMSHCEYFKTIKDQKEKFNQIAINNLKKIQETIKESHRACENSYKTYCMEQFLVDQLDEKTKNSNPNLEKKLKKQNINLSKFKKIYEEAIRTNDNVKDKLRKLDFTKLNYVTSNTCRNQQLQYYFSMEIPILLHLQNSQLDTFIDETLNTSVLKDIETSKFLIKQFEETFMTTQESKFEVFEANKLPKNTINVDENSSEFFYTSNNSCFNNLIQYDLQLHDETTENFNFTFQKENMKHLYSDYIKWSNKLNDLEQLMKKILQQVNDKKISMNNENLNNPTPSDFLVDEKLEDQKFQVDEKKMQMIQLQSKIDALGNFNINLKELEEYENADKFSQNIVKFDNDLYQNLELWDTLMKDIDEMNFSDESYDVDIIRKEYSTNSETNSIDSFKFNSKFEKKMSIDPNITPRYARTIKSFHTDESNYLSFESDRSLIIYNEVLNNVYKAKDYLGIIGFVSGDNLEFYKDETVYLKSVYPYEGLDEQELTFPNDVHIRLLRKNTNKKRIDGEEWWEGVYENKVGYFPAIFVQDLFTNDPFKIISPIENKNEFDNLDFLDDFQNELNKSSSPIVFKNNDKKESSNQTPLSSYQKVP